MRVCSWNFVLAANSFFLLSGTSVLANPLPTPVPPELFSDIRVSSPFQRTLSFQNEMILTGVATIEGKTVATITNRETGASHLISHRPNSMGWKLLEVKGGADISSSLALVEVDGGGVMKISHDAKKQQSLAAAARTKRAEKAKKQSLNVTSTKDKLPEYRNEEERKEYYAKIKELQIGMSDDQKRRAHQIMSEKLKSTPDLTARDKGTLYLRVLNHVKTDGK